MFARGGWDYEVSLWFPVSLLCFFKMSSLLQSFHSRDVVNGLAERIVVQEWREKVHAWGKKFKKQNQTLKMRSQIWEEGGTFLRVVNNSTLFVLPG